MMCVPVGGLAGICLSRHEVGVSPRIFTAYVPDGSYSYLSNSASAFLGSLTFPRAPRARVVHSQVEVRPAWGGGAAEVPAGVPAASGKGRDSRCLEQSTYECRRDYSHRSHEALEAQRG